MAYNEEIASLQYDLKEIEDMEIDENSGFELAKVEEYQKKRDLFLYRTMMRALQERVADGALTPKEISTEDEEMREYLREEASEFLYYCERDAASIQESFETLKAKKKYCAMKQNELEALLLSTDLCPNMNFEYQGEIDEEEIAAKEQELADYRKRLAAAEIQEQTLLADNERLEHEHKDLVAKLPDLLDSNYAFDERARLEKENQCLQQRVEQTQTLLQQNETVIQTLRELVGCRVKVDGVPDAPGTMHLNLKILEKYDLKITTEVTKRNSFTIVSATFFPQNLVIYGPTGDDVTNEIEDRVELTFPPLDDLIRLVSGSGQPRPGDAVRFLVSEVRERIKVLQHRAEELTVLRKSALTKIGTLHNSYQDIVCSLNSAQLALVLRLTSDCPVKPGSVYLTELVGFGGWDKSALDNLQEMLLTKQWQSPCALVQACKDEVRRLQQDGLSLPETPRLPLRFTWE